MRFEPPNYEGCLGDRPAAMPIDREGLLSLWNLEDLPPCDEDMGAAKTFLLRAFIAVDRLDEADMVLRRECSNNLSAAGTRKTECPRGEHPGRVSANPRRMLGMESIVPVQPAVHQFWKRFPVRFAPESRTHLVWTDLLERPSLSDSIVLLPGRGNSRGTAQVYVSHSSCLHELLESSRIGRNFFGGGVFQSAQVRHAQVSLRALSSLRELASRWPRVLVQSRFSQ
jgi:hypothetical protein